MDRQSSIASSTTFPGSASSLRLSVTSYLARFLKRPIYEKIKLRQTRMDHNLFDVIWPAMKKVSKERRIDEDLNAGIVAPDFDVFVVFQEFLVPLIKDLHCLPLNDNFKEHPRMQYFPALNNEDGDVASGSTHNEINSMRQQEILLNLDPLGKWIKSGIIECSRNLELFELPLSLNLGNLEMCERTLLEKIISMDFSNAIGETAVGEYYSMSEILDNPSEIRTVLAAKGLLIPLLDPNDPQQHPESLAINGQYWPYGRGVFVSNMGDLVAWINVQEHCRILCCTSSETPAEIGKAYTKVAKAMEYLERQLSFRHSYFLGYLASRPSFLGTSLRFTFIADLPNLFKDPENLRQLCNTRQLHMKTKTTFTGIKISNMKAMSVNEWELFQDYCSAMQNILQIEKDLSISSSMQIAEVLLGIFKKKKHPFATEKKNENQ
jgi:arginine kinase